MQFLSIVAFIGALYILADRHSSQTADGTPSLSSSSPATDTQSILHSYLCIQLKMWIIIPTRSYPENRINGLPQIYHACTWWLTISNNQVYTMPLPQEEAATKVWDRYFIRMPFFCSLWSSDIMQKQFDEYMNVLLRYKVWQAFD